MRVLASFRKLPEMLVVGEYRELTWLVRSKTFVVPLKEAVVWIYRISVGLNGVEVSIGRFAGSLVISSDDVTVLVRDTIIVRRTNWFLYV